MSTDPTALELLKSMDATLKRIEKLLQGQAPKAIASDRDLDSQYGDPILRFMPRDWTGPTYKGRRFSECPPELLDMVADTFDYFASQAEAKNETTPAGKLVAPYKRADAARARGWAKRQRDGTMNGAHRTEPGEQWASEDWKAASAPDAEDIPF